MFVLTECGRKRLVALLFGALLRLVVWLLVRPDAAGPLWTTGTALEVWLGLEALAAITIGRAGSGPLDVGSGCPAGVGTADGKLCPAR